MEFPFHVVYFDGQNSIQENMVMAYFNPKINLNVDTANNLSLDAWQTILICEIYKVLAKNHKKPRILKISNP